MANGVKVTPFKKINIVGIFISYSANSPVSLLEEIRSTEHEYGDGWNGFNWDYS